MKINQQLINLNLSVFLISTSGILGRLITLIPELTIFYRCVVASLVLSFFIRYKRYPLKVDDKKHWYFIIIGGVLMAIHWVTYFYALSLSSIAIAMITLHCFPALTAILEPLILKTKFEFYHLFLAILVIVGIYIILPNFDTTDTIVIAIACGILSAISYALRNIWTRKIMSHYNASVIMNFHLIIMSILLSPFLCVYDSAPLNDEWYYIILLALFTTVLGHTLLVNALKHFSAVSVGLISSIIPLYGIMWGIIFLDEIPNQNTIVGGLIIMTTFFIESNASRFKKKLQ